MIESGWDTFEINCIRSSGTLLENFKWAKVILAMAIKQHKRSNSNSKDNSGKLM